jgi:asparagine synthase (glutamine-hydrolysing)
METLQRVQDLDGLSQLQYHDLSSYLPGDILVKIDRAAMLTSLEVRCPLLDYHIFEFMAQVPPRYRVSLKAGKILLKKALGTLLPPTIQRRSKQGFSIPQAEWLRGPLYPLLREVLLNLHNPDLFDSTTVKCLLDEHRTGQADHKDRLWALLCFELWSRDYGVRMCL